MAFTITTWNVNSVRPRLPHLLDFLQNEKPDIVLLQEIKCLDEQFPRMEVEDLGYNIATHGQKTYNGVAILSKFPLEDISRGLPGDSTDAQARYIEALAKTPLGMVRVASVYVPNGQEWGSEKCQYKLAFLERLYLHMLNLKSYNEMLAIGGDYNIAPSDADVANPGAWAGSVLTHEELRTAFRKLLHLGLYDTGAANHEYSWWDYRAGGFQRNDGLRIDHVLVSPQIIDRLQFCKTINRMRALEKPSDHAPVMAQFA